MNKEPETIDEGVYGRGGVFDFGTYSGNLRLLLFSCLCIYALWHIDDVLELLHAALNISYRVGTTQKSKAHLLAVIIGGMGVLSSIVATVYLTFARRKARQLRQSAKDAKDNDLKEKLISEAEEIEAKWGRSKSA